MTVATYNYLRRYLNDPFYDPFAGKRYMWIAPNSAANGERYIFTFTSQPVWCSLKGVNQFSGTGFIATLNGTGYDTIFYDKDGNIVVPQTGDEILAEIL